MSVALSSARKWYQNIPRPRRDPAVLDLREVGDCPRKRAMVMQRYERTHPHAGVAAEKDELHTIWRRRFIEYLCAANPKVDTDVPISTRYRAAGKIDAVVTDDLGIVTAILVEPVSQFAKDLPARGHIRELQAALHFWGRSEGVNRGELVYIARETGAITAHEFPYDRLIGAEVEQELQQILDFGASKELPMIPLDHGRDRFPCFWISGKGKAKQEHRCQFYGHCWGEQGRLF